MIWNISNSRLHMPYPTVHRRELSDFILSEWGASALSSLGPVAQGGTDECPAGQALRWGPGGALRASHASIQTEASAKSGHIDAKTRDECWFAGTKGVRRSTRRPVSGPRHAMCPSRSVQRPLDPNPPVPRPEPAASPSSLTVRVGRAMRVKTSWAMRSPGSIRAGRAARFQAEIISGPS